MKRWFVSAILALLAMVICLPAYAEKVEVAPGVTVTRKTYNVPVNEAPFFNFVAKSAKQRSDDKRFVDEILKAMPDNATAARIASKRGWSFVQQGDFASAAKRFNQAFLLNPRDSAVYHGLAVVVFERFRDVDYADELFRIAARMRSPFPTLSADHGRVLLMAGRPKQAIPLLTRAMRQNPGWPVPRVNLAYAMLQTGEPAQACRLVTNMEETGGSRSDLAVLRDRAHCD